MAIPFSTITGSASIGSTPVSLVSGTTSLQASTTACEVEGEINFGTIAAGTRYLVQLVDKINGGSAVVLWQAYASGLQSGAFPIPPRRVNEGWDARITLDTGSAVTVNWSLKLDVADVNALTAGSSAVSSIQSGLATSTAVASVQTDTTTLTGRLTSTRAGNLDNLDAAVSSRAPASTAVSNTDYTSARATKIDNLDAAVTSRAAAATALSTTQWTNTRAGLIDNLDTAVSTRAPASTAVSNADYTTARAGKIDNLDATTSSRAPASTALSTTQWTNARAADLDNLDAAVTTRAPASTALSTATWTNTLAALIAAALDATISSRASAVQASDIQNRIPAALDDSGNIKAGVQSLVSGAITSIADAVMNYVIEAAPANATTYIQRARVMWSLFFGKASGFAITTAGTEHTRDAADSKDRVVSVLNTDGTRNTTVDGT